MVESTDLAETRCYRVTGRVQGVGFRWWTRRAAQALGLAGRVRNQSDGSVEVRARGAEAELDALEAQLREGPAVARVDAVERRPVPAGGDPRAWTGFEIERD